MKKIEKSLGVPFLLFMVFITLKLTNNIDWSWWWIFSPLLIPVIVFITTFFIFLIWGIILLFRGKTGQEISDKFNKISKRGKPQQ